MANYLPSSDLEFKTWVDNFITYANDHMADCGVDAPDLLPMDPPHTAFNTALPAHQTAQLDARSATAAKNTSRADLESAIRPVVSKIQCFTGLTDYTREQLGLKPRGTGTSGAELNGDKPLAIIDISERLRHVMKIKNVTSEDVVQTARPPYARGCEVWAKVGEAPVSPEEMTLQSVALRTPHTIAYTGVDAGKTAHYALRWINSRGEAGPWSETESATIAA